jgi:hypothetical protein
MNNTQQNTVISNVEIGITNAITGSNDRFLVIFKSDDSVDYYPAKKIPFNSSSQNAVLEYLAQFSPEKIESHSRFSVPCFFNKQECAIYSAYDKFSTSQFFYAVITNGVVQSATRFLKDAVSTVKGIIDNEIKK